MYFEDCVPYVTNGNVPYVTEKKANKNFSLAITVANLASEFFLAFNSHSECIFKSNFLNFEINSDVLPFLRK